VVHAPQAEPVVAVGAVVVDPAGRVLLVRRAKPPMTGVWTLPGGRLEAGETLEAAVVREVREETGIPCRVVCALGVVPIAGEGFSYLIHEHLLVSLGGTQPRAGDDAADARWVAREELAQFRVRPEVLAVVDRALCRWREGASGA
jgi:8-oxo-dGTP diphosphatase